MDPLASWSMRGPREGETPFDPYLDRVMLWSFEYTLEGAVTGAGRRVMTWTDGESMRADDGSTLLIDVSVGLVIRSRGSQPQVVPHGSGELYSPPFPEIEGLRSLRAACAWLDVPLPSDAAETIVFGRRAWEHTGAGLRVLVDVEVGSVLGVEQLGEHGLMRLVGQSCGWVEAWPGVFSDGLLPS